MEVISVADDSHSFGGIWTQIKLETLQKYLVAYTNALKNKKLKLIYIDAFAGTGRCDLKGSDAKTVAGSATLALEVTPAFDQYFFIELDAKKSLALHQLHANFSLRDVQIIQSDANDVIKDICVNTDWKRSRAGLFLDPFGMELEWSTLEAISRTHAIDLWYLFPYAGLFRQATRNANDLDASKQAALTRVLGTDSWREEFYAEAPQRDLFGLLTEERSATIEQMLAFVTLRLRSLFKTAEPKVLRQRGDRSNPKGAPLFALYFAVSNPNEKAYGLALRIANDILKPLG